jgi:hydroxypyruvate reductase
MRRDARRIFQAALRAADPRGAVERELARRRFDRYERIFVLGCGKASAVMAQAAEKALGRRITAGLVNVKYGHTAKLKRVEINECGHPVPDAAGERGARRILELAEQAGERDLVVCLISGGGSALSPAPAPPVTLAEKQATTKLLLECGAAIQEINAVRKHISLFKGGQLARAAAPAAVLSLLLSDVIGDPLDVIASGPTAPDESTGGDCLRILDRYALRDRVPAAVRERLASAETPKPGDPIFRRVENIVVGSNKLAVDAALREARALGYRPLVLSTTIEGETRDVARMHAAIAREIRQAGRPVGAPACVISGGETTVTLRGPGKGGRNQEFVLAAAIDVAGLERVVVFSAGTDGTDGPTDAAGAIADGKTLGRSPAAREYLERNDSYHYFEPLRDLVMTGPTGTNVMDVRLLLVG